VWEDSGGEEEDSREFEKKDSGAAGKDGEVE
jgi:hypothetical protein